MAGRRGRAAHRHGLQGRRSDKKPPDLRQTLSFLRKKIMVARQLGCWDDLAQNIPRLG